MARHKARYGPAPWFGPRNNAGHFQQGWWVQCTCGEKIRESNKPSLMAKWNEHLKA